MDCSCVYTGDYGEMGEFASQKTVKARVEHTCCECQRTIKPGEKYDKVFGVWDGQSDCFKTCVDCISIVKAMFCEGRVFSTVMDDLREHISECDGNISSECLEELTPGAREMVIEMIDEVIADLSLGDPAP